MRLRRHLKRALLAAFAVYGFLWTLIESLGVFIPEVKPAGLLAYSILVGVSIAAAIWSTWPLSRIEFTVPLSDSRFVIEFGNIFSKKGCVVIGANEYFDSKLGGHVSPNSLHGIFIRDVLGSQSSAFDSLVTSALKDISHSVATRSSGNCKRYRIGTTAAIDVSGNRYFITAFARTDLRTLKASATIHEMWEALAGLWKEVRVKGNGDPIFIPLFGSGLAGIGLPAASLIDLIMISFFYYTKKDKIASRVTLVLHPSLKNDIDLRSIKQPGV